MKIAVSGKGGVGKTLVAGVLAEFFVRKDFNVLAIDADPAPNLALTLGIPLDEAQKIIPISENKELIKSKTKTGFSGVYRLSFTVDDLIEKFAVKSPCGVNLLVMGTVRSAGEGCTCPANAVVRALLQHLLVAREEAVVMDMEAGVEHMGRGTAKHVDTMLIVADPSMKSLETAKRIYGLAKEADLKRAFLVGNKVAGSRGQQAIEEFAARNRLPLLALIPYDDVPLKADMRGETPLKYADESESLATIRKLGERLLQEGGP
ncbi:MAG: AAA family ATPase [Candidatus Bathyarchaeia archaeon]